MAVKSALNPFATCFVPSKFYETEGVEISEVTEAPENVKAESNELNAEENSNNLEAMETLDSTFENAELDHGTESLTEDADTETKSLMLFLPTDDSSIFSEGKTSELYGTEALAICHLILLAMLDFFYKLNYKDKSGAVPSAIEEIDESEECHCPPMFGWVLPPTFLGNPLKLKYNCSKDKIHTSWYSGKTVDAMCLPVTNSSIKELESYGFKVSNTLEQCSLELEMIIRDVCDSVSFYDSHFDFEENPEVIGSPTIYEVTESEKSERSVWNDVTVGEVSTEKEIVDDGSHPLLQSEGSSQSVEDANMDEVQKILEICLSPGKQSDPVDLETKGGPICRPPCSVWCDNVPPAVKEAYCKFVRQNESSRAQVEIDARRQNTVGRFFKRSLSADDATKYASSCRLSADGSTKYASSCRLSADGSTKYASSFRLSADDTTEYASSCRLSADDTTKYASSCRLSADDTTKYASSCRAWHSPVEAESVENKMLFRKDPVSQMKIQMLKDGKKQHRSHTDLSERDLRENCFGNLGERSNSWGPFDGADSLWKPLPDCVPSSENNPKHGPHRKFREVRRQRSAPLGS